MVTINIVYILQWSLLISYLHRVWSSTARVKLTSPVNPVKEGEIIALHCQIWNLQPNDSVSFTRRLESNSFKRLSHGQRVVGSRDGHYLATDVLEDGSVVYFLTIIDANREETGRYTCSILKFYDIIAEDSVEIRIMYFPSELFPQCSYSGSHILVSGEPVTFNCTSELGYPPIMFEWRLARGGSPALHATEVVSGNLAYSVLRFVPTYEDNNCLFLCLISSSHVFPDVIHSCHIGPFLVIRSEPVNTPSYQTKSPQIKMTPIPTLPSPICEYNDSLIVMSGTPLMFNCTSYSHYRSINVDWSQSGSGKSFETTKMYSEDLTFTELHFVPTLRDDGVLFLCKVTSARFPNELQECHVGPIHVTYNPKEPAQLSLTTVSDVSDNEHTSSKTEAPRDTQVNHSLTDTTAGIWYWTLAFSVATFVAIIILILGIVCVRFCGRRSSMNKKQAIVQYSMEDNIDLM